MEDWEGVLSDSSSGQEQSILRLIMGDVEDPSLGLNKLLHQDLEFNSGFGMIDQADAFGCLEMPNNLLPSIDPSADFPFNGCGTNATRLGSVSTPNHNPMFSVATSHSQAGPTKQKPTKPISSKKYKTPFKLKRLAQVIKHKGRTHQAKTHDTIAMAESTSLHQPSMLPNRIEGLSQGASLLLLLYVSVVNYSETQPLRVDLIERSHGQLGI
nr:hypothetical protein CFP56_23340 [Quercus suber]